MKGKVGVIEPEEVEKLSKKEYMKLIKKLEGELRERAIEFLEKTITLEVDDDTIDSIVNLEAVMTPPEEYMEIICGSCRFQECCNQDFDPRPCDKMFDKWRVQISIKLIPPERGVGE